MLTPNSGRRYYAPLLLCMALLAGCQSPFLVFSGGALTGQVSETDSFAFAGGYRTLQLEVNPEAPYSVILRTTVIDGELYIDAADARRWAGYLADEPRVRIKLGKFIYPALARPVSDTYLADQFLPGRTVYRIDPLQ